jgi:hypothetical protein
MNRTGPVLALVRHRLFVDPACDGTALRSAISEECANGTQNEYWCGAANLDPGPQGAKC